MYLAMGHTPYVFPPVRVADSVGLASRSRSDPDQEVQDQVRGPSPASC